MNEIMRDQFEQTVADCMDFKVEFVQGHRMSNDSYSHPGIALAWRWWKRSWVVASAESVPLRKDAEGYRHVREHSYVEVRCDSPRLNGWKPELLDIQVDAVMSNPS